MGVRRESSNGHDLHQEGVAVDPQAMIDALVSRVQQLTMENVMLQAAVNQLSRQEVNSGFNYQSPVGSEGS